MLCCSVRVATNSLIKQNIYLKDISLQNDYIIPDFLFSIRNLNSNEFKNPYRKTGFLKIGVLECQEEQQAAKISLLTALIKKTAECNGANILRGYSAESIAKNFLSMYFFRLESVSLRSQEQINIFIEIMHLPINGTNSSSIHSLLDFKDSLISGLDFTLEYPVLQAILGDTMSEKIITYENTHLNTVSSNYIDNFNKYKSKLLEEYGLPNNLFMYFGINSI